MADIADVEQLLRHLRVSVKKTEDQNFSVLLRDVTLALNNTDVDEYLSSKPCLERPVPTAIFLPCRFEQAVESQGHLYRLDREDNQITLEDRTQKRKVTLSSASILYCLAQLDSDELPTEMRRIMNMGAMRFRRPEHNDSSQPIPFEVLFRRIFTVKVVTTLEDTISKYYRKFQSLAEAALFHITYGRGIGINLSLSWKRAYYQLGLRRDHEVQFPLRTYTSELLAYYNLAFFSESLILAYLALYKVLEYFFTSSSDRLLHQKMVEKLVEPDFSHTKPKKLKELAKVIRIHDSKLDERRLLRTVLEHYFDVEEVRNWIQAFDSENNSYLTTDRDIFAEQLKVDISDDQLFASVANRIYHIRNALVHHKEGELSRFIPFSGQEEILYRELPLLLYLVEQIIIKTGKDL